jgi:hypothetical protein
MLYQLSYVRVMDKVTSGFWGKQKGPGAVPGPFFELRSSVASRPCGA